MNMGSVTNDDQKAKGNAAVVGGGLVGSLQACFLAQRGYQVDLYEARSDIREMEVVKGRSINLALSVRGIDALRHAGLDNEITSKGIPMRARRIHNVDGSLSNQTYDRGGQYILSIDRRHLNETLLTACENRPGVQIHFSHKLVKADLDKGELHFRTSSGEVVKRTHNFVVGTDGAFSKIRREIVNIGRLDYSQQYIPHGYIELYIPPADDGDFKMLPNFLHIWPRNNFMLIALPNQDHTFTGTLFIPFKDYDKVCAGGEEGAKNFFLKYFPDAIPVVGEENLKKTIVSSEALPLLTVKCSQYHYKDKAVILGDAAHAMVPFYGQGMNCGLEDCIILDEMLDKYNDNLEMALPEFSKVRVPDAQAICDLALYNYVEMRSLVNSKMFLLNKKIDNLLYSLFPRFYIPLYNMVTFSRIRYSFVIQRWKVQKKFVRIFFFIMLAALPTLTGVGFWHSPPPVHRFHRFHWGRFRPRWPQF